jgi:signal transduction histidine kinase
MAHSPSESASSSRVRILLVDDDEDDFVLTREVVADIPGGGYALEWVADFDTALDLICRNEFDVHLVDFRLGGKTGLDLLAAMHERHCNAPVILLTGVGQPEIDRAAEEAGAADYLEKSRLEPVLLERSIRYALRHRAQELELERKVAERTAELAAANAALRQADRRKDEFLGTLAHELRNPLAPIRNAIEIMRMQAENPTGVETARQMIERQVKHMVRLVDDLLDASRITRDKLRIELTRLDLGEPLRAAVEATQPSFDAGGLTFDPRLPDEPIPVHGDHVRLTQLFSNLLANAAKYTEPGGSVVLTVEKACSHVLVRVTDTGVGIPPDMLPRVFDLFAQVDHSLHRSHGGLGIGLALVKRLTEMHGGKVTAHSDGPGRGAEFVVSLPMIVEADVADCAQW